MKVSDKIALVGVAVALLVGIPAWIVLVHPDHPPEPKPHVEIPKENPAPTPAPKPEEPKELSKACDVDTGHAINDHERIGDQDVFHIRCAAPGAVTYARYDSCAYAGGERCSHINPRNERSKACADDPKAACIYYQTNDGNFKVIHGVYTYIPDKTARAEQ
jgi:hypothetical protein